MSGLNISFRISAIDDFTNTMKNLNSQTKQAFDTAGKLGAGMTAAGLGMAAGLGVAVNTAKNFESQVARVSAISGASAEELNLLRQSALDLGAASSKSASEVAVGQEELAKLGMTANEILGAMPGVISAAEASGSDMAQTAEVMASSLNIFGLEATEATRVADVLAAVANGSAASINDMQYALKYAGPPASALGVSLEELSASVGVLMDSGMKGEQAGTTLRGALLSLLNPSEENTKLMESMGIAITDTSGNFVGISKLVENLSDSMEGMTETQKAANLAALVGTESVSGMLSLMSAGPDKIDEFTKSLENSEGASAKTAAIMKDNLGGSLEQLQGALETASITIGTALTPAIQFVAEGIRKLIELFNKMPAGAQNAIAITAGLTAAFLLLGGPLLMFIGFIPTIVSGFAAISSAISVAIPIISALLGPVTLIVVAIAGLAVAFVVAYKKIEWFRDMVNAAWEWIKNATMVAFNFIKGIVMQVVSAIVAFAGEQLAKFGGLWDKHGAFIMSTVKTYFSLVKDYIQIVMAVIKGIFQTVWPIISNVVKIAWGLIKTIVGSAIDIVVGLIDAGMSLLQGDWKGAWEAIKGIGEDIMNNIIDFFKGIDLAQIGKDIIQGLVNGMSGMIGTVTSKVKEIAGKIPAGVKSLLNIHSPSRVMMALGGYTAEGLALGIGNGLRQVERASAGMASAAVPNMGSASLQYGAAGSSASNRGGLGAGNTINLTVNYSGSGSREDAQHFAEFTEKYLSEQFSQQLRISGVKG
ncbi:phage tail tape measure protein [Rossellomorea marisflavi]|uniref:Phage tail tape measure protein n=1 Tax=Rossellomorea marisflavi TaxID=189381 RepID=A0A5D4S488_9BACI|nr:phage tail tape measure protein [Rossellomorea marisflavi]TYS56988.1 phage tail tape measure protein [Rossellomorea marisflavi]